MTVAQKGGPLGNQGTPVCPHDAGSHSPAQVPIQAKARALYAALGPCIWRTDNGGTVILSAEALRVVDLSHSSAFSSGAKH